MALGAIYGSHDYGRMPDGLRLVTAGLILGGLAAVSTMRSLSVLLFGVNAMDPTAFAVAGCMLLLVPPPASCVVAGL